MDFLEKNSKMLIVEDNVSFRVTLKEKLQTLFSSTAIYAKLLKRREKYV